MYNEEFVLNSGTPYIAMGMNYSIINDQTLLSWEYYHNKNYREIADRAYTMFNKRKYLWQQAAYICPTLNQFLENKYNSEVV